MKDKEKVEGVWDSTIYPAQETYFQNETWFEVSRYDPAFNLNNNPETRKYILVINSYGSLRKLFTETGGFESVN